MILALMSYETRNIERFDSRASHAFSLRPARPCHGSRSRSILDHAEFTLSEVEGLEMTDMLFVRVLSVKSV
jgi:hypothetical protein